MGKKIADFMKGEIASSIFYILFGLCLVLLPELSIQVICKVIFGVVLIGAGIYHIWIYTWDKGKATILDLFTGVIVLVLGGFLYVTPQIIVKLLPYLLGAFIVVDNIWLLKGVRTLKKLQNRHWKTLLVGSVVFLVLGVLVMVYPFSKITDTVLLAGGIMLADGISDLVFLFLLKRSVKKASIEPHKEQENTGEKKKKEKKTSEQKRPSEEKKNPEENSYLEESRTSGSEMEVDEGEREEDLKDEIIINGRWKAASDEETESPGREIEVMQQIHEQDAENAEEENAEEENAEEENAEEENAEEKNAEEVKEVKEDVIQEASSEDAEKEPQEEILEEWKD